MGELPSSKVLTVFIIGGGVGGLVAAIFLAQAGHEVVVIEHKARYADEDGANGQGLNLTVNATRCLYALGIEEDFLRLADVGQDLQIKSFQDGSAIRTVRTLNGHSMIHRADLLRLLVKHAIEAGAKIHIKQSFLGMIEHADGVGVMLEDGRCLQADLVIGADGINSRTRSGIVELKDMEPVLTEHCTFLIDVPKEAMACHEATRRLYEDGKKPFQFWMGPERSIVGWTMTHHDRYHLQMNDHAYGDGLAYGEEVAAGEGLVASFDSMDAFRKRWGDFEPAIHHLLSNTSARTKWRIAELPDLPTWSSPGARIVLLGDAAHAMAPYAGQGAAMAIEDAAVLSTFLSNFAQFPTLGHVATAYEKLRRPRVQGFREIVHSNAKQFGLADPSAQAARYHLQTSTSGREHGQVEDTGRWTTEERYRWVDNYDAVREAEQYLRQIQNDK